MSELFELEVKEHMKKLEEIKRVCAASLDDYKRQELIISTRQEDAIKSLEKTRLEVKAAVAEMAALKEEKEKLVSEIPALKKEREFFNSFRESENTRLKIKEEEIKSSEKKSLDEIKALNNNLSEREASLLALKGLADSSIDKNEKLLSEIGKTKTENESILQNIRMERETLGVLQAEYLKNREALNKATLASSEEREEKSKKEEAEKNNKESLAQRERALSKRESIVKEDEEKSKDRELALDAREVRLDKEKERIENLKEVSESKKGKKK